MSSTQILGLIVGGLLPALFYGLAGFLAKTSTNTGIAVGPYLICIGVAVSTVGVVMQLWLPGPLPSIAAIASSGGLGLLWGTGTGCVALALLKYQAPLAKLVPLYNMNTLIAVVLALVIYAEWQTVKLSQLAIGAVLVTLGGILVSLA